MNERLDPELMALHDKLVADETRVNLITEIDFQLKSYKESPDLYILPNACKWMTPALEAFGEDPEGWLRFIRRVRREFPKRSESSKALAEVYRRVDSRVDAQIRRARLARAVAAYIDSRGHFADAREEKEYAKDLQLLWTLTRKNRLISLRRVRGDTLPYEVQSDLFEAFWGEIDQAIEQKQLPHRDELSKLIADAQRFHLKLKG